MFEKLIKQSGAITIMLLSVTSNHILYSTILESNYAKVHPNVKKN